MSLLGIRGAAGCALGALVMLLVAGPATAQGSVTPSFGDGTLAIVGEGYRAAERVEIAVRVGGASHRFTATADARGRFRLETGLAVPPLSSVEIEARDEQGLIQATITSAPGQVPGAAPAPGAAGAQIPGVTVEELARGRTDHAEAMAGPAEVVTARVTLEPGSSLGWHTHPGPVTFAVTTGEVSWYGHDGCRTPYPAGSAGIVGPGEVHDERNEGAQAVALVATYLVPAGAPLRSPAEASMAVCGR